MRTFLSALLESAVLWNQTGTVQRVCSRNKPAPSEDVTAQRTSSSRTGAGLGTAEGCTEGTGLETYRPSCQHFWNQTVLWNQTATVQQMCSRNKPAPSEIADRAAYTSSSRCTVVQGISALLKLPAEGTGLETLPNLLRHFWNQTVLWNQTGTVQQMCSRNKPAPS
jgi:hypothetical protein